MEQLSDLNPGIGNGLQESYTIGELYQQVEPFLGGMKRQFFINFVYGAQPGCKKSTPQKYLTKGLVKYVSEKKVLRSHHERIQLVLSAFFDGEDLTSMDFGELVIDAVTKRRGKKSSSRSQKRKRSLEEEVVKKDELPQVNSEPQTNPRDHVYTFVPHSTPRLDWYITKDVFADYLQLKTQDAIPYAKVHDIPMYPGREDSVFFLRDLKNHAAALVSQNVSHQCYSRGLTLLDRILTPDQKREVIIACNQ